jgi:hypothetical protein
MPRGVYIEIRHKSDCPWPALAEQLRERGEKPTRRDEARRCRCTPVARARVAGA